MRVTVCSMHFFHSALSKAKNGSVLPLVTGGNWKKSPVMTNCGGYVKSAHRTRIRSRRACIPPKGRSVFFRRLWAIDERVSNKWPSTMETSPVYSNIVKRESGIGVLTLVDDQHFSRFPSIQRRFTRPNALDLFIEIVLTRRDSSPRMDSHTCRTRCNRVSGLIHTGSSMP